MSFTTGFWFDRAYRVEEPRWQLPDTLFMAGFEGPLATFTVSP